MSAASTCGLAASPFADTPLIASWPSGQDKALEAAVTRGIVVVRYDGCRLEVLEHCTVSGGYRFVGSEPASAKVSIADERALATQVFGDHHGLLSSVKKGEKLGLELSAAGSLESNKTIVLPTSLAGKCEGATHYVTGILVGSYAVRGPAGTLLDGAATPTSCASAAPKKPSAPSGCDRKLRAQLAPIRSIELRATREHDKSACPDDAPLACSAACASAKMSACTTLGWMLEKGTKVLPGDPARAAMLYRAACFSGEQLACNNLAILFLEGRGVDKDEAQAPPLLRMACSGGHVRACANLGTLYRDGVGVSKDSPRAVSLFRKACDAGDGEACGMLGRMLDAGEGTPRDTIAATTALTRGCVLRDADSCNNLGVSMLDAPPETRNESAALKLFQLACTGGVGVGCRNLGILYANGLGVHVDKTKAAAAWDAGCALGLGDACERAGALYLDGKDRAKGLALLEAASSKGSPTALLRLARAFDADPQRAFSLVRRACEGGIAEACTKIADYAAKTGKTGLTAASWLQPLCEKGQHGACTAIADLKLKGIGLPKDPAGALKRYEQACDAGETIACARGAGLLVMTPKVPLDGAVKMLDRACENGDAASCRQVSQLFSAGVRVAKDPKRALFAAELACLVPDAASCVSAAALHEQAAPTKAQAFYARACDAGLESACAKAKQLPAPKPAADPLASPQTEAKETTP